MTIQIIRRDGKIRGVAFFLGKAKVIAASDEGRATYWRICDHCGCNEAVVFCQTHSQFVCASCLAWHGRRAYEGDFILGYACRVMSMSVARSLSHSALTLGEAKN